jgi:hypothetical protein
MTNIISIKDNKLHLNTDLDNLDNLNDNLNEKIKIVSIIGKARGGKSTFSNLLISSLYNENKKIFNMSDLSTHCTNGVDYYFMKEHKIILLDFQGIYLGDSSQDSKLLLLAYLLSDIIIFNENKILSNNTLQQFEPMLSFLQYINKDELQMVNPKLIFRISDVNLDIEPTTNMQQMLSEQKDQFQSIRDCINLLFDEPFSIATKNLDRNEFKLLKNGEFIQILDCEENGFDNAIFKILDYIDCCEYKNTYNGFIKKIQLIINNINNEEKIDYTKLDVVSTLQNYEILEYLTKFSNDLYTEIDVDYTQKSYEDKIIKRENERQQVITSTYSKFNTIPKNIIDLQLNKILSKIDKEIDKAKDKCINMSKDKLKEVLNKYLLKNNEYELKYNFSIINFDDFNELSEIDYCNKYILNDLNEKLNKINNEVETIYKNTYYDYISIKNNFMNNILKFTLEILKKIKNDIDNKFKITNEYINNLKTSEINLSDKISNIDLKFDEPISKHIEICIQYLYEDILEKIELSNKTDIIIITLDKEYVIKNVHDYDTNSPKYNESIKKNIRQMLENKLEILENLLTKQQENNLYLQKNNIENFNIITNNPQIIFVKVNFTDLNKITNKIMTKRYFDDTLHKDLQNIFKIMKDKGYIYCYETFIKSITDFEIVEKTKIFTIDLTKIDSINNNFNLNNKDRYIWELFCNQFKKYYLRKNFIYEF